MGRVLYLDCFSGAAGDMLLGALLDAGLPRDVLDRALGSLGVAHELRTSRVVRAGISAVKVDVLEKEEASHAHDHTHPEHAHHEHPEHRHGHRSLSEIVHLISHSNLTAAGQSRAQKLFRRLAQAEAAIHAVPLEQVHLHEVGAVDSIIDIVGAVAALEWFGIDDIVASPLNVGSGRVQIAHGSFPVPAPATLALLAGVPVYSDGPAVELVTPTGALVVSDYAREYGGLPRMIVKAVGYGAGTRDFPRHPNVLRVVIGERAAAEVHAESESESIVQVQCEIDDMNPQFFASASDRLFAAGAVDVFLTPVQMKKSRPGTLVTVLAPDAARRAVCDVLFRETTTIGVRFTRMQREVLDRRYEEVATDAGPVRIKVSGRSGSTSTAVPEYDDCLRIAERTGRPVRDVYDEALRRWNRTP